MSGNATLFDGSTVETADSSLRIQLDGGQRLQFSNGTRAQVFGKKVVLEAGFGQVEAAQGFEVEARSLRISAASADTVARIRLASGHKVMVAAVRGSVRVANSAGMVVAMVPAGESLDFEPSDALAPVTKISGCLLQMSGKFILAERTTNTVLEVQGVDLLKQLGNRVEIAGTASKSPASVSIATQLVQANSMKMVAKGGCTAVAKKLGASVAVGAAGAGAAAAGAGAGAATAAGAAGAATAAGVGTAATVAVVGGVATAATVGGLAAVGSLPGQSDEPLTPSASR